MSKRQLPFDTFGKTGQFTDKEGNAAGARLDDQDRVYVTGSVSDVLAVHDGFVIRDTILQKIDVKGVADGLRNVWLSIDNTLDQTVSVGLLLGGAPLLLPAGIGAKTTGLIAPYGTSEGAIASARNQLQGPFPASTLGLAVSLQCSTAPTTGVVTVKLWGAY